MKVDAIFLSERLIEIEDKYDLFSIKISEEKIWQYIRYRYWVQLCEEFTNAQKRIDHIQLNMEKTTDDNWKMLLRKQQFLLKKKDLLVINHPRRVKDGDIYKCFVTDTLLKYIDYSYYVFEDEYRGKHDNPVMTKNLKYRDFSFLENLFVYNGAIFRKEIRTKIDQIHAIFEKELSVKLSNKFKKNMYNFTDGILRKLFYGRIHAKIVLSFVRPKALLVVVHYNIYNQAIIEVAKKMGIVTIELEHGRIGCNHPAYNFKKIREIESFPDYIFVYGKYEKDIPRFPIQKEKICITGYPELEVKSKFYKKDKKSKIKTVLFISSPSEGKIISQYATYLWKQSNGTNIKIIYKLHPLEYGEWRKFYPELEDTGIEVIDNNSHDIYYFLGMSDYVVGISSTTLFEAMQFEIKIIIIKGENSLICEPIYTNGHASLAMKEKDMLDIIINSGEQSIEQNSDFYFTTDSLSKAEENIRKCINENKGRRNYKRFGRRLQYGLKLYKVFTKNKFDKKYETEKRLQDKKNSKKYFSMYLLMAKWIKLGQENRRISEYFISRNYKEIAIYGMDVIGETLYKELNSSGIKVAYAIDKAADGIYMDIDVIKPEDNFLSVDAIVVTPFIYFNEIKGHLEKKIKCPIVSIEDIICQIEN